MNKLYMSHVVPRYSRKIVEIVPSIIPQVQTSSYSGRDLIVEDELPTEATGRVNAFFEACSKIKATEGKGGPGKVGPNKKQRAGIKRKDRGDKLSELKRIDEIEQEKLIEKRVKRYAKN